MHEGVTLANSASERRRLERTGADVETPDTRRSEVKSAETKIEAADGPSETERKGTVEGKLEHVLKDLERSEQAEVSENAISSRLSEAFRELEAEEKREQRPLEKQLEDAFKELAVDEALEKNEAAVDTATPEVEPARTELHEVENDNQEVKEKQQKSRRLSFRTMDEIDRAIAQHQHLERNISPERYEECKLYMDVISQPDELTYSEVARQCGVDEGRVSDWRSGRKNSLISLIQGHEEKRIEHECSIPSEALEHRIDPERVNDALSEIRKTGELSPRELTDAVERLYSTIDTPRLGSVHYAELYDTRESLMTDWRRELAKEIHANREEIESSLNERLGLAEDPSHEVRIAVTDDRMYYWHKDSGPNKWLNVLEAEKLYFRNKEDKIELIDEVQRHLHVRGTTGVSEFYLNDIVKQLSHLENAPAERLIRRGKRHYVDGETLHFINSVTGRTLDDLRPTISRVGRWGPKQIANPKWPEIRTWRIKTVAIAESDCYLDVSGTLTYYEKDRRRRQLAIRHFQEFGDFDSSASSVSDRQEDMKRVRLSVVYGRMARYFGVPEGDKAIRNKGLAECIIKESLENKIEYLREMVGEDGTFSGRFGITRASTLHAGVKAKDYETRYGIKPKVTQEDIDFVLSKAEPMSENLCYGKGDRVRVRVSALSKLRWSEDEVIAEKATRIVEIIWQEKSRLLQDEVYHIIEPLGIRMTENPTYVTYYADSRRLSVEWIAKSSTKEDTIRWALLAPPNHPEKLEKVVEFLRNYPERAQKVRKRIEEDGLSPSAIWEDYDI